MSLQEEKKKAEAKVASLEDDVEEEQSTNQVLEDRCRKALAQVGINKNLKKYIMKRIKISLLVFSINKNNNYYFFSSNVTVLIIFSGSIVNIIFIIFVFFPIVNFIY